MIGGVRGREGALTKSNGKDAGFPIRQDQLAGVLLDGADDAAVAHGDGARSTSWGICRPAEAG